MLELLWIAPKNESRPKTNAEAVNCKYSTHFNPANRRELRIAVVSKREFGGGENIQPK
jgi:hypothetical protein